jgi:hypothetical protein
MFKKGQNNNSSKSSKGLIFWGSIFLFVSVLLSSVFLIYRTKYSQKNIKENAKDAEGFNSAKKDAQTAAGQAVYKSELFKFAVDYPKSLTVNEEGSGGGYIDFVRFEDNGTSSFKGFAVGVSEQSFDNEVKRIKKAFTDENAYLAEETTIDFQGLSAKQLYYKPQSLKNGEEERTIVIFNKGKYSYSISTIPYQLGDILSRFQLLD